MGEQNNCRVIAIANQKGGVGKTTTTSNLGIGLARQGKRVLLIDADAQGSLTASLGYREPDKLDITLANVMGNIINEKEMDVEYGILRHEEGVDLMPGNIELSGIEVSLVNVMSRETVLRSYIEEQRSRYDYILIDCSPSLGLITINALTAADSVIIPVQAEYFALEGISKLLNTIKIIKSKLNPALEIEGFLLTMYDSRLRQANQIYDEVKRHFQELVFKTVIQRNVKLSEAPSYGLPTILYDAESTGAKNHLALAKELISRNSK